MKRRWRVEQTSEGVLIRLPSPRQWVGSAFLLVWLSGWTVGGFAAAAAWGDAAGGDRPFLTLWLCGWFAGEVVAASALIRLLFEREAIYASRQGSLAVSRSFGPFRRTLDYSLTDLRSASARNVSEGADGRTRRHFSVGLQFKTKTVLVGGGLKEADAEEIAGLVRDVAGHPVRPVEPYGARQDARSTATINAAPVLTGIGDFPALLASLTAASLCLIGTGVLVGGRNNAEKEAGPAGSPVTAPMLPRAAAPPTQARFTDPGDYSAALTAYSLRAARIAITRSPACDPHPTFDAWSCQAPGRAELGPYSSLLLTYECHSEQPAFDSGSGTTTLCGPLDPPPLDGGVPVSTREE